MYKYRGCHGSCSDTIGIQTNSLTKIINAFVQQLKKEGISCVTNIVLALYGFFISSNRRNAPLLLVFSFFMLDDVELNHNGEQYILVQNERNSIYFRSSEQ